MLAHAATFEGKRALNAILADIREGSPEEGRILDGIDFDIIPAAVFTRPEVATVGLTEEDCKDKDLKIKCLKSIFRANGKAVAMGEADGYCKIITDAEDGRVGQGIAEEGLHHQSAHGECRPGEQRSPCCRQTAVEDDEPCRFAAAAAKGVYILRPW